MVRTQVQLTERQAAALKEWAADEEVSMAHLVREAVDNLLRQRAGLDHEERRRRAVEPVGAFGSGCTDVAEEHDRELSGAFGR